jgi:DNA-binding PadR family transcriptional regulator
MPRSRSEQHAAGCYPLTPLLLHILVTLADGERHGYAIMREIRSRTNAALNPKAGSFYLAIRKLLSEGAIEESSERPDPRLDDKRRRYYRITDLGRRAATEEVERLREVIRFIRPKFPPKSLVS